MFKKSFAYILTFCFLINLIPFVSAQTFSDVFSSYPYYSAIESLADQGIINGYADKTFRPDAPINRVEILKILLLSGKINVEATADNAGFPDVISDAWYTQYIVKAKEKGIIKGNPDGRFYPEKQVNFAEALKMLALTNQVEIPTDLTKNPFLDVPKEAWFAPYFAYAQNAKIIEKTSSEKVEPGKTLNRGEVAQLIFLFQQNQNVISEITETTNPTEKQIATYYADALEGNATASGEIFDQSKLTAAHKTLPFGTQVKVTNLENNESVIVTINDRGPHNSDPSYVLDLSKSAFQTIAPLSRGIIEIKYEVITPVSLSTSGSSPLATVKSLDICQNSYEKKTIPVNFFENFTLEKPLPNIFRINEIYNIRGQHNGTGDQTVTVFFIEKNSKQEYQFSGQSLNGVFDIPVFFKQIGNFELGIILGTSGKSLVSEIKVIALPCTPNYTTTAVAPTELKILYSKGESKVFWNNQGQKLSKIEVKQGEKNKAYLISNNQNFLVLPYQDFVDFSEGEVSFTVYGANSASDFSFDQSSTWIIGETKIVTAVRHHQIFTNPTLLENVNLPETYIFGGKIYFKNKISSEISTQADIISPSGLIENSKIVVNGKTTVDEILSANIAFEFDFTPATKGTYIVEINGTNGLAVINLPIYEQGSIPLLPDFWDLNPNLLPEGKTNFDLATARKNLLEKINQSRTNFNFSKLSLNENLTQLAQARAEDMAKNKYLSHNNLEGKTIEDLKNSYGIKSLLGENIAQDVNISATHNGLFRSASHRANILNSKWTRVGLGIAVNTEGYLITVEVFGDNELSGGDIPQMRSQILQKINLNRAEALVTDSVLEQIAQEWSDQIVNRKIWFEDPLTGLSLGYLIGAKFGLAKQNSSIILKGDFAEALTKLTDIKKEWKKIGSGISQNNDGSLNITIIYSD